MVKANWKKELVFSTWISFRHLFRGSILPQLTISKMTYNLRQAKIYEGKPQIFWVLPLINSEPHKKKSLYYYIVHSPMKWTPHVYVDLVKQRLFVMYSKAVGCICTKIYSLPPPKNKENISIFLLSHIFHKLQPLYIPLLSSVK